MCCLRNCCCCCLRRCSRDGYTKSNDESEHRLCLRFPIALQGFASYDQTHHESIIQGDPKFFKHRGMIHSEPNLHDCVCNSIWDGCHIFQFLGINDVTCFDLTTAPKSDKKLAATHILQGPKAWAMGLEVVKCHVEGLHGVTVLSARILLETLTKPEEQFF